MDIRSKAGALLLGAALIPLYASASSHREAPAIAGLPRLDGTDFYMFRSYEPGRSNYITFIANYIPLQEPSGGPNFYSLDTHARYEIRIARDGHATTDLKLSFAFTTVDKGLAVDAGGKNVAVPLINIGEITPAATNVNVLQRYTIEVENGAKTGFAENLVTGGTEFWKPVDNVGNKSIPDYASYAANYVYPIRIPNCTAAGRVFVGQRKEGFVVNLGEVFDLVNLNPAGPRDAEPNTLYNKNVTSLAVELPISCLTTSAESVIGGYTASVVVSGANAPELQASRLGMPLVNELVIGLPDKDKFNASQPQNDTQFLTYVTNPTLPVLLNTLFGNAAIVPATRGSTNLPMSHRAKCCDSIHRRLRRPPPHKTIWEFSAEILPGFRTAAARTMTSSTSRYGPRKVRYAASPEIAAARRRIRTTAHHTRTRRAPPGPTRSI
jgi:hypothetical protein